MANNSENSELLIENEEIHGEKEETSPKNEGKQEANEEVVYEKPAPKSRGRPAGSKDNKPRIKRVPVLQPPPPLQEQEAAAEETTPLKKPRKKVEIRYEEDEPQEKPEEQPPPPKSPRTLHRERVQSAATQRRQLEQARQDRFERILDNFMGF